MNLIFIRSLGFDIRELLQALARLKSISWALQRVCTKDTRSVARSHSCSGFRIDFTAYTAAARLEISRRNTANNNWADPIRLDADRYTSFVDTRTKASAIQRYNSAVLQR